MKLKKLLSLAFCVALSSQAAAQTNVVAHRGFWKTPGSAQNSLAALSKADSAGCYGSEFDIWITKDNKVVAFHDSNIGGKLVENHTYDELSRHTLANGEKIPTLEQYLELGKKLNIEMVCEIKPHADVARTLKCVELTLEAVRKHRLTKRTTYITFSLPAMVKLLSEAPRGTEVYYLNGELSPKQLKEMGAAGFDYHWSVVKKHWDWIDEAHRLGMKVNVWTVNDPAQMKELASAGVDYITTDEPVKCGEVIEQTE